MSDVELPGSFLSHSHSDSGIDSVECTDFISDTKKTDSHNLLRALQRRWALERRNI